MSEITRELSMLAGSWQVAETYVTLPGANIPAQLCQPNPLRWGLLLGISVAPAASSVIAVSTKIPTMATFGINLTISGVPFIALNYRDNPALVQSAWYAISAAMICIVIVQQEVAIQ